MRDARSESIPTFADVERMEEGGKARRVAERTSRATEA